MAVSSKLVRARWEGHADVRDGAWEEFQRTTKVSSIADREVWEVGTNAEAQVARHFDAHGLEVEGFTNDNPDDDGVDGRILMGDRWWPVQAKGSMHTFGNLSVSAGAFEKYQEIPDLLLIGVYPNDLIRVGLWANLAHLVGDVQEPTMGGVPWRLVPRRALHRCRLCVLADRDN